jgi:CubicO group peptidase (beta-lactamase class C family)
MIHQKERTMTQSKINLKPILFFLLLIGNLPNGISQDKAKQIDELLTSYAEYGMFSGSALVVDGGETIYKNGFGLANIEWNISNTPQTKFRIGSLTKQFTAMLVMQQVEAGKLDLQQPISKYLPDYPKQNGDIISIHHLLTHTSGTPNFTAFPEYNDYMTREFSPEDLVQVFADSALEFTPGTQYNYSNSGYVLLGYILETVAETSYEDLLQNKIFAPLNMRNSGYDHHATILTNRATGYFQSLTKSRNAAYIDMSVPYAAGAIYSTVEDLFVWDQALYSNELLSEKHREQLFTPHTPAGRFDYGYGWAMGDIPLGTSGDSVYVVHHSGGINGFTSLITRFPKEGNSVILTGNIATDALEEITRSIANVLYGQPFESPKKPFAREIYIWMKANKPKEVVKLYSKYKNDKTYSSLNEAEMNQLGYEYLWSHRMDQALAVFEINVDAFPNSSNAYDSYGEALIYNGDRKASIENYKKSVELNPYNQNGIDMLKRMGVELEAEDVSVAESILKTYTGIYQLMPSFSIVITLEDQKIYGQGTGQPKLELLPKSENHFYSNVVDAQVVFNKNQDDGKITSLTLIQGGAQQIGNKVK